MKFHENLCSESQVVLCGWADGQTHTHDGSNHSFHSFVKTPINEISES